MNSKLVNYVLLSHDLLVTWEVVAPGAGRRRGKEVVIHYGLHATPFGDALFAATDKGLCALRFVAKKSAVAAIEAFRAEWPDATFVEDQKLGKETARRVFPMAKRVANPPVHLHLRGTNFQIKVWQALISVPFGARATYSEIAARIRRPKAVRAVGTAVGKNPVAFLIPCHRVVRVTGEIGNYRWGAARKAAMLEWEASQALPE